MPYKTLFKESKDHLMNENAIFSHLMENGIDYNNVGEIPFEKTEGLYKCKPITPPVEDIQSFLNEKLRTRVLSYQISEIASKSGLYQSNISNWMRGKDLGIYSLEKIAKAFGYKISVKIFRG